jgi:SAM-dependent methyltransferase
MAELEWTGERYVPWLEEAAIGYEHVHRYAYASLFVTGKSVLDLASGEGYGTYLLSRTASSILGVDVDARSVRHASNKYVRDNLQFKVGSILDVPIEGKHVFDVIVCFEALEHVETHDRLLKEVKRLLARDGLFILSTPNKVVYRDERQYANPFHVHELYFDELRTLLERHFEQVKFFGQEIYATSNIWPIFRPETSNVTQYVIERTSQEFVFVGKERKVPLYFIGMASDSKEAIVESGSNLFDISNELIRQKDRQISNLAGEKVQLQQLMAENEARAAGEKVQLQRLMAQNEARAVQLRQEVSNLQDTVQAQQDALRAIEKTAAWMLIAKYRHFRDGFLPAGSRRRRAYNITRDAFRVLVQDGPRVVSRRVYRRTARQLGLSAIRRAIRKGTNDRFALYTSSLGNYFFTDLRDVLAAGLKELGFEVSLRDERHDFDDWVDWHVVLAPHEFFALGRGSTLRREDFPRSLILINTEQPSTKWFALATKNFPHAHHIWDINYESARAIRALGFACDYLRLGYTHDAEGLREVSAMPAHAGTCFLDPAVRDRSYLDRPISERPIDILFLGHLSPRRENFFAKAAPVLSSHRCYLHLSDASEPLVQGRNTFMNKATSVGLAQRSKIVLNLHHGQDKYFEWHRIVMLGIWQRALVVSEPCNATLPFRAGVDFVEAELENIPAALAHYLSSTEGQREAQRIAQHGFNTLISDCKLVDSLRPLINALHRSENFQRPFDDGQGLLLEVLDEPSPARPWLPAPDVTRGKER